MQKRLEEFLWEIVWLRYFCAKVEIETLWLQNSRENDTTLIGDLALCTI